MKTRASEQKSSKNIAETETHSSENFSTEYRNLSKAELLKLIRELQTQKEALERQNQELLLSREALSGDDPKTQTGEFKYQELAECITDLFSALDTDLRYTYRNSASEKVTRIPNRQAIGKAFTEVFPELEGSEIHKVYLKALRTRQPQSYLNKWIRPQDGRTFYYDISVYPTGDGIAVFSKDITGRFEAEEKLRYQATLLDYIHDAVVATDQNLSITAWNRAAETLYGWKAEEAMGRPVYEVIPSNITPEKRKWNLKYLQQGKPVIGEVIHFSRDGKKLYIDQAIIPLLDKAGKLIASVGANHDITTRKQTEIKMQNLLHNVNYERQRAEDLAGKLEIERDTLSSIMENTRTQLAYLDRDFNFVKVNTAYAEGSGYPASELIGKNHFELFPHQENKEIFKKVRDTGEAIEFRAKPYEFPGRPQLGVTYWDWTLIPVKDDAGHVLGLVFSLQDVTQNVRDSQERERLLTEIQNQRLFMERLMKVAPVGIAVVRGAHHRYEFVNPAYQSIPGTPDTPMVGHTIAEVFPEVAARGALGLVEEVYRTGKTVSIREYSASVGPGRENTYWNVDNVPLFNVSGDIDGVLIMAIEITDIVQGRKNMESLLARDEAILESMTEGLVIFDLMGNVLNMNAAALRMHGFEQVKQARKHMNEYLENFQLLYPDNRPMPLEEWPVSRVLNGETFTNFEAKLHRVDTGSKMICNYGGTPVKNKDGNVILGILTLSDITRRKAMENELREAHDDLELRVKSRTAQLEKANEKLEIEIKDRTRAEEKLKIYTGKLELSNRELQDFAFVASHDLQEPLRKILAFGDRLKLKYDGELGEDGKDYLQRMQNAAARMRNLINALLDYSRVNTRARPFEAVDLNTVLKNVTSNLETVIEQNAAHIEIGELPVIEAEPFQMEQVFQNLVGNALKFRRPDAAPHVKISAKVGEEETKNMKSRSTTNKICHIYVEDNGIGFEEKYLDRIFVPFQRLHARHEYEGTGIGLAICRKIIERHAGTIDAKSTPGKGTQFVLTLPLKQNRKDNKE